MAIDTFIFRRKKIYHGVITEVQHIHVLPSTLSKTSSLLTSDEDELKATRNKATPLNRMGQNWKLTRCPLIL